MITFVTSGPDYMITQGDLDELSRAAREMPIKQLVTLGGSPGLDQWAKSRRIPVRIMTNLPEVLNYVDAAIVFPGRYMDGLIRMLARVPSLELWDWRGTEQEAKRVILASSEVAAHYDAIVNGDIEPIGANPDMRGRTQDAA